MSLFFALDVRKQREAETMLFAHSHRVAVAFVADVSAKLKEANCRGLSLIQQSWLAFCLTALICTSELNWDEFERGSLGTFKAKALGAMLKYAHIPWTHLWWVSIAMVLRAHGVTGGLLVGDDSERPRSKETSTIFGVHKTKDKKTGGFVMAQNLVLLLLVTEKVTIPVGFAFFRPDLALKAWEMKDKILREQGYTKSKRPAKPARNPDFPSKTDILASLIAAFKTKFPDIKVKAILFDAAYLTSHLRKQLLSIYPSVQVISQLKSSQLVQAGSRPFVSIQDYFKNQKPISKKMPLRGGQIIKEIEYIPARLFVKSHGRRLYVVAMRYKGEEEYRYITATDLTWKAEDILRCYSFRWLVEVEIEDWKLYEGYGRRAMQQGADGACRGVTLSFVVDHLLLSHPLQVNRSRAGLPLYTVGTICSIIRLESLLDSVIECLDSSCVPEQTRAKLRERILRASSPPRESSKHLAGRENVLDFEPSPSLKKQRRNAA
jgi:hypothetical protein